MSTSSSSRDQELLLQLIAGYPQALGRLLDKYRTRLVGYAQNHLGSGLRPKVDPEDIVQTAFLEVTKRVKSEPQSIRKFRAWLFGIVRNQCLRLVRQYKGTDKRDVGLERPLGTPSADSSASGLANYLVDPRSTPGTLAGRHELIELMLKALHELPDIDQEILLLRYYEHMENGEVAEILGMTNEAASMRCLRAQRRLRKALGGLSGVLG
jgi:RNA polymerase sigma-70 factor, ECF subfamily